MPRKTSPNNKQKNDANLAIWASVITLIGVIATAYFNYLSTRTQIGLPISTTQTAEAKAMTLASPTDRIIVSPTEISTPLMPMSPQPPAIIFGPVDGELVHDPYDNGIARANATVYSADFILYVEFFNPYDIKEGEWSYGVGFRETGGNQEFRLEIYWDGSWDLYLAGPSDDHALNDQNISAGYIEDLDTSPTGSNRLRLTVQGDRASFVLNDILVSTLDVSAISRPGKVWIGTGFINGQEMQGKSTGYKNFTVWLLP